MFSYVINERNLLFHKSKVLCWCQNSACEESEPYGEFLVELVGEQGVWQFSEIQLAQRANAVDVLDVNIFGQVRNLLGVKLMAEDRGTGNI